MQLSSINLPNYLIRLGLCPPENQNQLIIKPVAAKNFNLLVTLPDGKKLLVKQERYNQDGKTAGEFGQEWRIQEFVQHFRELATLHPYLPQVLHFDLGESIIIFRYLDEYRDVMEFYTEETIFPSAIAASIGTTLAAIHRATFNREDYRHFFWQNRKDAPINQVQYLVHKLERVEPEIFGQVPPDVLKFIALYQRYDSLGQAMTELGNTLAPCCVTHNDLKLNNILLHNDWHKSSDSIVRLIDWERSAFGHPAFDVGTLIANYLQIWLNSLLINNTVSIEESLRLAVITLEQIQPSIVVLTQAYLDNFQDVLDHCPDFLRRVVQCAGFGLIRQVMAILQNQASLGNTGICVLQVAKSLLCRPDQSMLTIFGTNAAELTRLSMSAA
ncbi:MAG: aminoglycoside phosphotransferase family protein [Coleofasciculus sp. C1-SOL-03]|uniref:aminoglycoside phosphotransferase family protein n=1 Tax=Coleofasciculus sp. C1-SOL-03 TaxID=3069522 RepID=UPI003300A8EA